MILLKRTWPRIFIFYYFFKSYERYELRLLTELTLVIKVIFLINK